MLNRLYRYGKFPNSHDLVKFLAIVFMTVDHIGLFIYEDNLWFRVIGRLAAPLFFFLFGYVKNHRVVSSLLIYGIIITSLTYLFDHQVYINILINFLIIKLFFEQFEPHKLNNSKLIFILNLLIILNPISFIFLEYGTSGMFFAIAARLLAENDKRSHLWMFVAVIHYLIYESISFNFINHPILELAMLGVTLSLLFIMWNYSLREWRLPRVFSLPLNLISRYSLQVYFWQLLLLKCYYYTPLRHSMRSLV